MTPEKVALVQTSFQKVVPIAGVAADIFYDRLFEIAPDTRSLFPKDMTDQKSKLMQMLGAAVNGLSDLDAVVPVVQELGARHNDYNVTDEHYDSVGAALIFTLGKGLGDDFTPETEEAWTEVYGLLAGVMKDAQKAAAPAPKKGILARIFG